MAHGLGVYFGEIKRKMMRLPSVKITVLAYLIKLSGLSAVFRAVVLAHNHQHGAGGVHGLHQARLQVALWAVPLSILPGAA